MTGPQLLIDSSYNNAMLSCDYDDDIDIADDVECQC